MKFFKVLLIGCCVIFMLIIITATAAFFILPDKIHSTAVRKMEDALHRPVELESIELDLIRGIVLNNLIIYDNIDKSRKLCSIPKAYFTIIPKLIFTQKTVIIPTVTLESPVIHLIQTNDQSWNIDDLLALTQQSKKEPNENAISIAVLKTTVTQGRITIDQTINQQLYSDTLQNLNFSTTISLNKQLRFYLNTDLAETSSHIDLSGTADLNNQNVTLKLLLTKLNTARLNHWLQQWTSLNPVSADIEELQLNLSAAPCPACTTLPWNVQANLHSTINELDWHKENLNLLGSLTVRDSEIIINQDKLKLNGQWDISGIDVRRDNSTIFAGTIKSHIRDLTYENKKLSTNADVTLFKSTFELDKTRKFAGSFLLTNGHLDYENGDISLSTSVNCPELNAQINAVNYSGPLSFDHFLLSRTDSAFNIKTNLQSAGVKITLKEGQTISARTDFSDVKLLYHSPEQWTMSGNLKLTNTLAHINEQLSINGNWTMDKISVINEDGNLTATGNIIGLPSEEIVLGPVRFNGNVSALNSKLILNPDNLIDLDTDYIINQAQITYSNLYSFKGNSKGTASLTLDRNTNTIEKLTATADITDSSITGTKPVEDIDAINGLVTVSSNQITFTQTQLNAIGAKWLLEGSISDFSRPVVDLQATTPSVALNNIPELYPQFFNDNGIVLDGNAAITGTYKGAIDKLNLDSLNISTELNQANVESKFTPLPIQNLTGSITFASGTLQFTNFQAIYDKQPITINGNITPFNQVSADVHIVGDTADITAKAAYDNNKILIEQLGGQWQDISFQNSGSISLENYKPTAANITSSLDGNLTEIQNLFPQYSQSLAPLNAKGYLHLESKYQGPIAKDMNTIIRSLRLLGTVENASLANQNLSSLEFGLADSETNDKQLIVQAKLFDGAADILTSLDVIKDHINFESVINIQNIDINKAIAQEESAKKISGFLDGKILLTGDVLDIMNVTGRGNLILSKGYLWHSNFNKDLFNAISSTLSGKVLEDFVISDATVNFAIADQKVMTENLILDGKATKFNGEGYIDFDTNFVFKFSPIIDFNLPEKTEFLQNIPNTTINKRLKLFTIFGNIKEKKFSKKMDLNIADTISDSIITPIKKVGGFLQELINN